MNIKRSKTTKMLCKMALKRHKFNTKQRKTSTGIQTNVKDHKLTQQD